MKKEEKKRRQLERRVGTNNPNVVLKSQVPIQQIGRRLIDQVPV